MRISDWSSDVVLVRSVRNGDKPALIEKPVLAQHTVDRSAERRSEIGVGDLSRGPALHEDPGDTIADLETAAPLADRHHLARSIGKGHDPARSATAIAAVRDQQVTLVERHRLAREEQLARPRLRRRPVDEREAVAAVPRRTPVTAHLPRSEARRRGKEWV